MYKFVFLLFLIIFLNLPFISYSDDNQGKFSIDDLKNAQKKAFLLYSEKKDPLAAGMFSLVYSGIGEFYNGQYTKGSFFFLGETVYHSLNYLMIYKFQTSYPLSSMDFFAMNSTDQILLASSYLIYFGLKAYCFYDAYTSALNIDKEIDNNLQNINVYFDNNNWKIICSVRF